MLPSCGAVARAAAAAPQRATALAARAAAAARSRAAPSCRRGAHCAPQCAARRTPTRAALPSLGAALRRAASAAAAAMAAATGAATGAAAAAPWRDPTHFTKDRWWDENTVAVVRARAPACLHASSSCPWRFAQPTLGIRARAHR
jgi:hypothetical protein